MGMFPAVQVASLDSLFHLLLAEDLEGLEGSMENFDGF